MNSSFLVTFVPSSPARYFLCLSALTLAVFFSPFAAPPDAADALLLPRPPIRYLLSEMKKPPWWTTVGRIYQHAYLNCSSI